MSHQLDSGFIDTRPSVTKRLLLIAVASSRLKEKNQWPSNDCWDAVTGRIRPEAFIDLVKVRYGKF